jgi:hypothetical protein
MIDRDTIVGTWTHAHEEDHDDVQVFRPGSHPLPPSRGRETFTLHANSAVVAAFPGPDDRGESDDGTWSLEGDVLTIDRPGATSKYELVAADSERLELRPLYGTS